MAFQSEKIKLTPEGGIAVQLIYKGASPSVKGYVMEPSSTTTGAVNNVAVNLPDPIGIAYEAGITDGNLLWVVVAGIADVYYTGDTVLGYFARVTVTADTGDAEGVAIAEALPTSPFATDKHFQEIGHVIEARTGAGLAKTIIHFN